jgi:hypothetical protein
VFSFDLPHVHRIHLVDERLGEILHQVPQAAADFHFHISLPC